MKCEKKIINNFYIFILVNMKYTFERTIELRIERTVNVTIEADTLEIAKMKLENYDFESDEEETVYEADGDVIYDTERKLLDDK